MPKQQAADAAERRNGDGARTIRLTVLVAVFGVCAIDV
jgi:hypothetical protein